MRKLFLFLVSATALTSQALSPDQVLNENHYFEIVTKDFAYKGVPSLYIESDESTDDKCVYKLFTEAFEEKETVTFNSETFSTGERYQFYRPVMAQVNIYMNYPPQTVPSLDEAKQRVPADYNMLQAEGGVYFFFITDAPQPAALAALTTKAEIEKYLKINDIYCEWYFLYEQSENTITEYAYQNREYGFTGEFTDELVEQRTSGYTEHVEPMEIYPYYTSGPYDTNSFCLTQTLFNDDEDYEALMPIVEVEETSEETVYSGYYGGQYYLENVPAKKITTSYKLTGYKVVKGNTGEVVMTLEVPGGDFDGGQTSQADLFITSVGKFLNLYNNDLLLVYDLSEGASGSVQSPKLIESIKVRPSIVSHGEEINVAVGDNTEIEAVTVTDMRGATHRIAPHAGKRNATINSGRLSRGMHIVGVETTDGAKSTSQKVIVR